MTAPPQPARRRAHARGLRRGLVVVGLLMALAAAAWFRPGFTIPLGLFDGGRSIASLKPVTLGGVRQWVLIRGEDRSLPILLWLHGGPGDPLMYLPRGWQRPLEHDFVVVQWDRRGAGKSYDKTLDPRSIRTSREAADTVELIGDLQKTLGQRRVILIGQDYGGYLGVAVAAARPDLVRAYVGVGQSACTPSDEHAIQDSWLKDRSAPVGDSRTYSAASRGGEWDREAAIKTYGGDTTKFPVQAPMPLVGAFSAEYTLPEAFLLPRSKAFVRDHLVRDGPAMPLAQSTPGLDVPVYFFIGEHDYIAPGLCVERYAGVLRAPIKHVLWFDHSAHYPFLEEPTRFHEELLKAVAETTGRP